VTSKNDRQGLAARMASGAMPPWRVNKTGAQVRLITTEPVTALDADAAMRLVASIKAAFPETEDAPEPCPTCEGHDRTTVNMICMDCGTDYLADPPRPIPRNALMVLRSYRAELAQLREEVKALREPQIIGDAHWYGPPIAPGQWRAAAEWLTCRAIHGGLDEAEAEATRIGVEFTPMLVIVEACADALHNAADRIEGGKSEEACCRERQRNNRKYQLAQRKDAQDG
jgi:hypothetical protein